MTTLKFGTIQKVFRGDSEPQHRYIVNISGSAQDVKEMEQWLNSQLPLAHYHFYNMSGQTDIVLGWISLNKDDATLMRLQHDLELDDWHA